MVAPWRIPRDAKQCQIQGFVLFDHLSAVLPKWYGVGVIDNSHDNFLELKVDVSSRI